MENESHNAPKIVYLVRIIKVHRPLVFPGRECPKDKYLGIIRNVWWPWVGFNGILVAHAGKDNAENRIFENVFDIVGYYLCID